MPLGASSTTPRAVSNPLASPAVSTQKGKNVRVLIGKAFGLESPVRTFSKTLYLDVAAGEGSSLTLPSEPGAAAFERAVYSVDHPLIADGTDVPAFTLAVLTPGLDSTIIAPQGARYVVIGGEPLDGPRVLWWNFVASSQARIDAAKDEWKAQRMGQIRGEHGWIPLP